MSLNIYTNRADLIAKTFASFFVNPHSALLNELLQSLHKLKYYIQKALKSCF